MPVAIVGNHNHCHFAAGYFFQAPVEAIGVAFQLINASVVNDSGVTIIRMVYVHGLFPLNSTVIPQAQRRGAHEMETGTTDTGGLHLARSRLCRSGYGEILGKTILR